MSAASNLARRLIAYDRVLARDVLELVVDDLGGPGRDGTPDLDRLRRFLLQPDAFSAPAVDDPRRATGEWKTDFAHREAMRALACELVDLLA